MSKQINAGKYTKKIAIVLKDGVKEKDGFIIPDSETIILGTKEKPLYASVQTTKGFTLIQNNSDFEKAYTNFTIRYPQTEITRDMIIKYNTKEYSIEYLNNVDEENIELEIQAKVVVK